MDCPLLTGIPLLCVDPDCLRTWTARALHLHGRPQGPPRPADLPADAPLASRQEIAVIEPAEIAGLEPTLGCCTSASPPWRSRERLALVVALPVYSRSVHCRLTCTPRARASATPGRIAFPLYVGHYATGERMRLAMYAG